MAYFNYFPEIAYDVRGDKKKPQRQAITNILIRIRKKLNVVNASLFEQYFIREGDRADTLAHQFYGDSTLHWIIMYTNYMTNPYYDWPLTYYDLQMFIAKKYENINGVHHYEIVMNEGERNEIRYEVDGEDQPGVINELKTKESSIKTITNFLYEEKKNDEKRSINIIRSSYISEVLEEFKTLIKQ